MRVYGQPNNQQTNQGRFGEKMLNVEVMFRFRESAWLRIIKYYVVYMTSSWRLLMSSINGMKQNLFSLSPSFLFLWSKLEE